MSSEKTEKETVLSPSTSGIHNIVLSSVSATGELAEDRITAGNAGVDDPAKHESKQNKLKTSYTEQTVVKNPETEYEGQIEKKPLYGEDNEPKIYSVTCNLVTPVLITKNLPDQFSTLPIYGRPKNKQEMPQFYKNKIREFVGYDLNDEEFEKLSKYCSPDHLRTGDEIQMPTNYPTTILHSTMHNKNKLNNRETEIPDNVNLCIHKKFKLRIATDVGSMYCKKFKYRGIRIIPFPTVDAGDTPVIQIGKSLEPGKELLFRIRIYRSYNHNHRQLRLKDDFQEACEAGASHTNATRHSVLTCDVVMLGRQLLSALRDRFVCANDVGMRLDHSNNPDNLPESDAKDLFPSGFLFINNVFYVDTRAGCSDHSAGIRAWAARRGLGRFAARDMCTTRVDDVPLRLGHPEVYVHQGNCEHLFTFSEIRVLGPRDPSLASLYPLHRASGHLHSVYCTTCAEFGARWVVVGCDRVPFDPAFFCETCFKLYLYKDGRKIGNFKAYSYRGNEMNVLKPQR